MGMKPKVQMPPPIDPEVKAKEKAAEDKLDKEKKKITSLASSGNYGTILTGGSGVTEEAETSQTMLGGYS
jgi:molybdopterin biosynthesis enzyme MoaB